MIGCIGAGGGVIEPACQGRIDCAHLQSTLRLETPAGVSVTELAATGQTCVFLEHWDCDDVYVPLDGTESITSGAGTITYDSILANVTKWIYTADGTGTSDVVFSLAPAASASGSCDLTIPLERPFTGACQGLIDCTHLQSTLRLETPAGVSVTELADTGQTCVFLEHWDCDDVYVTLDGTESITSGSGTIVYDSFSANVTKWIYTADGTGTSDVVFSLAPAASASGRCNLTIPLADAVQPSDSRHEGVGTPVATAGFSVVELNGNDQLVLSGASNQDLLSNAVVRVTGNPRWAVRVENTTDSTMENFAICVPASWKAFFNFGANPATAEPVPLRMTGNTRLTLNNFNVDGGHRAILSYRNSDVTMTNWIASNYWRHGFMAQEDNVLNGKGTWISDYLCYKYGIGDVGGITDSVNFFNVKNPTRTVGVHRSTRGATIGGHGSDGSGIIVDGYAPSTADPRGGVWIDQHIALDNYNKATSIASGRDNLISNFKGYQGAGSPGENFSNGNNATYIADFFNQNQETAAEPEFTNNVIRDSEFYWVTNGAVRQNWSTTTDTPNFFGHPTSDYAFINNDYNATFTRDELFDEITTRLANVPCFDVLGKPVDDFWRTAY